MAEALPRMRNFTRARIGGNDRVEVVAGATAGLEVWVY